jgi:hypothetical protein
VSDFFDPDPHSQPAIDITQHLLAGARMWKLIRIIRSVFG